MKTNLHTHTCFSDGLAEPEKYIEEAISQGVSILGFSDHSPIPISNTFAIPAGGLREYCDAISLLRNLGSSSPVTVLTGLEYDYIPSLTISLKDLRRDFCFDYIIGSVHLVTNDSPSPIWFIDGPKAASYDLGLQEVFKGDVRKAVTAYWRQVQTMIISEKPDIVGHLDKIKMHNRGRYFSETESWYLRLVDETLEIIRKTGCVVEVNTRGLYKKRSETTFPGPEILKKIRDLNIPVTVTSDAHKPDEIYLKIPEIKNLLKELGFKVQWALTGNGWVEESLL